MSGNISPPGTAIVTLQPLDPIYRRFLPAAAGSGADQGRAGQSTREVDTYPGPSFHRQDRGDQSEGRYRRRATCRCARRSPIPIDACCPGCIATVEIDVGAPQRYVTLPQTAITYNPYGNTVYLVEDKGKDDERASRSSSRAADLRHHRRDARRPGRDPERRQGRRHGRDRRPAQAAQRLAAARSTTRSSRPTMPIPAVRTIAGTAR